mmetsp:Transcript_2472/g.5542  ORF Transcript_2472/g.5542 Transcript_2472/m.5542 type:complete len:449 (+) Transcript_2472:2652-3998(+)
MHQVEVVHGVAAPLVLFEVFAEPVRPLVGDDAPGDPFRDRDAEFQVDHPGGVAAVVGVGVAGRDPGVGDDVDLPVGTPLVLLGHRATVARSKGVLVERPLGGRRGLAVAADDPNHERPEGAPRRREPAGILSRCRFPGPVAAFRGGSPVSPERRRRRKRIVVVANTSSTATTRRSIDRVELDRGVPRNEQLGGLWRDLGLGDPEPRCSGARPPGFQVFLQVEVLAPDLGKGNGTEGLVIVTVPIVVAAVAAAVAEDDPQVPANPGLLAHKPCRRTRGGVRVSFGDAFVVGVGAAVVVPWFFHNRRVVRDHRVCWFPQLGAVLEVEGAFDVFRKGRRGRQLPAAVAAVAVVVAVTRYGSCCKGEQQKEEPKKEHRRAGNRWFRLSVTSHNSASREGFFSFCFLVVLVLFCLLCIDSSTLFLSSLSATAAATAVAAAATSAVYSRLSLSL